MVQFLGPLGPYLSIESLKTLLRIASILVVGLITLKLINSGLKRLWSSVHSGDHSRASRTQQRTETLRHIVGSFGKILLWSVVVLMILSEFNLDIKPLLTGAGILGLAVGFGAQTLVKDFISGFFILLEDQYGVGDSVRIGDQEGVVEHMTLRTTILRNFEGNVHVIPNGSVATVSVMSRDWGRAVVDIPVPHNVEIGRLFHVLEETGVQLSSNLKDQVIDKPQILGIEKFSDNGVTVRLAAKTLPYKRADVTREWKRIIKESLEREGIDLSPKPPP